MKFCIGVLCLMIVVVGCFADEVAPTEKKTEKRGIYGGFGYGHHYAAAPIVRSYHGGYLGGGGYHGGYHGGYLNSYRGLGHGYGGHSLGHGFGHGLGGLGHGYYGHSAHYIAPSFGHGFYGHH